MAGTKRTAAEAETSDRETGGKKTRAAKATKTPPKSGKGKGKGKGKKGPKASLAPATFKANALPLHVSITHTPPALPAEDAATAETEPKDPGALGAATLLPTTFSTGSYGWKGNKRVTVEVPGADGQPGEKLQVMISMNATVIGSKTAKGEKGDDAEEAAEGAADGEEAAEEAAEEATEE
ncbi:hypothetical protein DFH11DRAFT_1856122 [Phellopilus nigrolimitatus]|nr:hypothetical protein DFH11DRAFT_1856122 [Phellopilus nigrolimitatus]